MTGDLPDYTKYVSPQPQAPVTVTGFGTKAETVAKKIKYDVLNADLTVTLDAAPDGKKIGLIFLIPIITTGLATLTIQTLQSAVWTDVFKVNEFSSTVPNILVLYCWVPDQDEGDGTTQTVRISITGVSCGADAAITCMYYYE